MNQVVELYGVPTSKLLSDLEWLSLVDQQHCPYLGRKCTKFAKVSQMSQ